MKKIILVLLILTFACTENKKRNRVKKEIQEESVIKYKDIKYINAKSGLIFRNKPKGKRLGKFEFNERIDIVENTNIFQEIKNGNETLKGEWVGTKKENKIVYIFSGFLSSEKITITPEIVKYFMEDKIWLSNEFVTLLDKTKLVSKAYYESDFYSDIAFSDEQECGLFCDKSQMEPDFFELDFSDSESKNKLKIIDINNVNLVVKKENKHYTFTKSENKTTDRFYKVGGIHTASSSYERKWIKENFTGKFSLKTENKIINLESKDINYYFNGFIDIMDINKKTYSIEKLLNNKYYLSEIEFDVDEIDGIKNGKTAILRKK